MTANTLQAPIADGDGGLVQMLISPSSRQVHVYEVVKAPITTAIWIQNLLGPALAAIKLENARPIEFRPTGDYAGWFNSGRDYNPDNRISLSNQVRLYTPEGILRTYLHELSHALLQRESRDENGVEIRWVQSHGVGFFALNLVLLLRLDAANFIVSDPAPNWPVAMRFYDLTDPPWCWEEEPIHIWKPKAIAWSMTQAHELFATDLSAEKIAAILSNRYYKWAAEMAEEPVKLEKAKAAFAKKTAIEKEVNLKRKNDLFLFKSLFFLVTAAFMTVVYVGLTR